MSNLYTSAIMQMTEPSNSDSYGRAQYEEMPTVGTGFSITQSGDSTAVLTRPFAHLNLRFNPFGEMDLSDRASLAVVDVESLRGGLANPGLAVQFIGDKGRGKTTHVLALHALFPKSIYIHLIEGWKGEIPRGNPLMIDEVQRLPLIERRSVFRRPVSFVLGTHVDYSRQLRRAGLEVITIYPGKAMSPRRLKQIIERRIESARRDPGPVPTVLPKTIDDLLRRFGDDVRGIEACLYERFQSLSSIENV